MIVNIRGTNGSGKTTLARQLITPAAQPVDLAWYSAPTKRDPERQLRTEGWGVPEGFLAVGKYGPGCGGMDTIPSFGVQRDTITAALQLKPPAAHVVCEGILASTVAGSWVRYFDLVQRGGVLPPVKVLVCYLDTPLELCLERIRERQIASGRGEREIKIDQVAAKWRAIAATRPKFVAAGIATATLRYEHAEWDLRTALEDLS